jgi:orotate phosphoribosyltransferase-like protein
MNPCIIVDDIIRSGRAIQETVELVKELGADIIGCGTIVRFTSAPDNINGIPIKSLIDFESKAYENGDECDECTKDTPAEHVRF